MTSDGEVRSHLLHTDDAIGPMLEVHYNNYGGAPFADHDMPCQVCMTRPAIIQLTMQYPNFQPCWECQRKGWVTVRAHGLRKRILRLLGLIDR